MSSLDQAGKHAATSVDAAAVAVDAAAKAGKEAAGAVAEGAVDNFSKHLGEPATKAARWFKSKVSQTGEAIVDGAKYAGEMINESDKAAARRRAEAIRTVGNALDEDERAAAQRRAAVARAVGNAKDATVHVVGEVASDAARVAKAAPYHVAKAAGKLYAESGAQEGFNEGKGDTKKVTEKVAAKKEGTDISSRVDLNSVKRVNDSFIVELETILKNANPEQAKAVLSATVNGKLNLATLQGIIGAKKDGVLGNDTVTKFKALKTPSV